MLDRNEIALAVSLKFLGVFVRVSNYQNICNVLYVAQERGLNIGPKLYLNPRTRQAYAPRRNEMPSCPFNSNLIDSIREIESLEEEVEGWEVDRLSKRKLEDLKKYLIKL